MCHSIRLSQQYKREQIAELEAEREKQRAELAEERQRLEAERLESQKMMSEFLQLKQELTGGSQQAEPQEQSAGETQSKV